MNSKTILKGAFIAFCLIGMLVLPAAAAPAGQMAKINGSAIDQGLKDDLWANHQQNRLETFDLNVRHAQSTIGILEKYGIDTTACKATLDTITSKRSTLESALTHRDVQGIKAVNAELRTLWQQFIKDVRDAIQSRYGKRAAGGSTSSIATAGFETAKA